MKERYFIFKLVDVDGFPIKPNGLMRLENEEVLDGFENADKAKEWVENNGERQTDYVVLQIFRKS